MVLFLNNVSLFELRSIYCANNTSNGEETLGNTHSKLKTTLLQRVEEDFHAECQIIIQQLDHYKTLLNNMAKSGRFSLLITVRGTDIPHHEYENDVDLLERCGVARRKQDSPNITHTASTS